MGGVMSSKPNNSLSVPATTSASNSSPTRQSPAKRVSINPNPVTIPSSEPLPVTTTTTTVAAAGTVRGTIPVADTVDPSKVTNVTVSVASEHSYADANKKTDSSSDSSSSTSSSSSSSDEDDDIEDQVDQVLQSIIPAEQQTSTAATPKQNRGRPRKNAPSRVPPPAASPVKRPHEEVDDKEENKKKRRGRGCGACPGCVRSDCGTCQYCKDKPKFGGPGKKKQRCSFRVCSNFVSPAGITRSKACVNQPAIAPAPSGKIQTRTSQAAVVASIRAKIAAESSSSSQPVKEINSAAVTPSAPPPPPPSAPSPLKKQGTTSGKQTATTPGKQTATTPGKQTTTTPGKQTATTPGKQTATTPGKPATAGKQTSTLGKQATPGSSKTRTVAAVSPAMLLAAAAVSQGNKSSHQVERCVSMCVLTSLCLLENFRKSQSTAESSTSSTLAGKMMKCCQCGRERKLTIARTDKFCTQRCLKLWEERHPGQDADGAVPISSSLSSELFLPPPDGPQTPRAIKNLHIDMAYPGTVLQRGGSLSPPASTASSHPLSAPAATAASATSLRQITPRPSASTNSVARSTITSRSPVTSVTAAVIRSPPTPAVTSVAQVLPAVARPTLSNGIKRTSQVPPVAPPTKKHRETKKGHELPVDVLKWSVRDVGHYFESTVDCRDYSAVLEEQEVDGAALLLVTSDTLVKCLSIKLGPALKIMMHVERLKAQKLALS